MTLFGDLDVSTLRDMPAGPAEGQHLPGQRRAAGQMVGLLPQEAPRGPAGLRRHAAGRGIRRDRRPPAWTETYEALANGELEAFRLGLIHGRMAPAEKDAVMDRFRSGEIQVLVSTSVVEVGVDVPNATLMTIEGGHRFGLAQLHQLRGRISRGKFPGFCCVFGDPQTEESHRAAQGVRRLDRRVRVGRDRFQAPRPRRHLWHEAARPAAACGLPTCCATSRFWKRPAATPSSLVTADPGLASDEHAKLRRMMMVRYGKALELGDVG